MFSYYGERASTHAYMTLDGDGGRESRKNTRPRDYGRTLFLLREEKPKEERVRGWRGGLQQRRSDMSKEKLRELYRVDRHACQNSRSAQASARSPNRTTSSSYTVASARPRVLNTSALSRTLEKAERRRTPVGRAPSVKLPWRVPP